MAKQEMIPWYKPSPGFKVTDGLKEFSIVIFLTFVAGGLNALIALLEGNPEIIPPEYIAFTGLILAVLHTLYTIVTNWRKQ